VGDMGGLRGGRVPVRAGRLRVRQAHREWLGPEWASLAGPAGRARQRRTTTPCTATTALGGAALVAGRWSVASHTATSPGGGPSRLPAALPAAPQLIQRRCQVCNGRGLVQKGKYLKKCAECGGFFPWISWRLFLTSTAAPGNGGEGHRRARGCLLGAGPRAGAGRGGAGGGGGRWSAAAAVFAPAPGGRGGGGGQWWWWWLVLESCMVGPPCAGVQLAGRRSCSAPWAQPLDPTTAWPCNARHAGPLLQPKGQTSVLYKVPPPSAGGGSGGEVSGIVQLPEDEGEGGEAEGVAAGSPEQQAGAGRSSR